MRVHIFDPLLGDPDGDSSEFVVPVAMALKARGMLGSIFGPANLTRPLALRVLPAFSHGIFHEVGEDYHTWAIENFMVLNEEVAADLAKIDASGIAREDLVFFPNILQNQIEGIRVWLMNLPEDRRPAIALKVGYLTNLMPYMQNRNNAGLVGLLMRQALWRLMRDHRRTTLCTDTPELVQQLLEATGQRFKALSGPTGHLMQSTPFVEALLAAAQAAETRAI